MICMFSYRTRLKNAEGSVAGVAVFGWLLHTLNIFKLMDATDKSK